MNSITVVGDKITTAYNEISSNHVLWATALEPVFEFEIPGLVLTLAAFNPETGQVMVTGIANNVSDIVSYRAHVEGMDPPPDLVSESIQQIDGSVQYDAEFKLN